MFAGEETIKFNHALMLHPNARTGILEGNPVNEDMAEAAVWFLEGAANVTGEILIVDAGAHLGAAPLLAR